MAENKKSFVLYADLLKSIEHLTNEEKGILFNHLLLYVNDKNPVLEDRLILTAWKPIELQLKRDLIKFEEVKEKRSNAGKRSAEIRALQSVQKNSTNPTSVKSVQQSSTNPTDNVTVNDNVTVTDNVINKEDKSKGVYFDDLDIDVVFLDFLEMRKKAKKPATEKAISLLKEKLRRIAKNKKDAIEVIQNSLINNWTSFYPLKKLDNQTEPKNLNYKEI